MSAYVLGLDVIDQGQVGIVGGKGAHLGELSRIDGVRVPAGFCVTTDAFDRFMAEVPSIDERLDLLAHVGPDDHESIRTLSTGLRHAVETAPIPDDLATAITEGLARLGEGGAWAVRSSATAEDLVTASFAGQHDTYLNVVGQAAVLEHISRCWASLFTERAVAYRLRNGVDHRLVRMAVVVQRMVVPDASGIIFTADPVTSDRSVVCVEAVVGLGEPLVSGRVTPDTYRVRDGRLTSTSVATKPFAVRAAAAGGTEEVAIPSDHRDRPALTGPQVLALAHLGRRIEAHVGCPQDIEWCLVDGYVHVVQSRPITTLFPVPVTDDGAHHLFVSVGHNQMMTDAMKPLGISFWLLTTPRPMFVAGGRLFVDVARQLGSPVSRAGLLDVMGKGDPLIRDALETVLDRDDFIPSVPDDEPIGGPAGAPGGAAPAPLEADPELVSRLIASTQESLAHTSARHRRAVGNGAGRVRPGGHPGAEADPLRSAEPSGVHVGHGGHVVAEPPAGGMAGREERGRHAHTLRPRQRDLGDGTGAPGRRRRHPAPSGRGGLPRPRRGGRGLPGRSGRTRGRAGRA